MAALLATSGGIALLVVAVIDVIQTVFQPIGDGFLSTHLERGIWRLFARLRRRWPRLGSVSGTVTLFAIAVVWVALLVLGAALIYWPHLPAGFVIARNLPVADRGGFGAAVYFSLVTVSTLGYGDIAPVDGWLRILSPLEAILGIALVSATISWLLSIYAVLSRTWSLASELKLLRGAVGPFTSAAVEVDGGALIEVLGRLTTRLVTLRSDLLRFPITYYYSDQDSYASLWFGLIYLQMLAAEFQRADAPPQSRLRLTMLEQALAALAGVMTHHFLRLPPETPPEQVFAAVARHHVQNPNGTAG